ncbi:MAG: hypothetical protein UIM24_03550 [Clostridia bacterium]|nr:hypothetical protein [Clostridia bacterium]
MKERFKSLVLVVLVILNFILGSRVLSTEKLWSGDGYNFFVSGTNNPITEFFRNIKLRIQGKSSAETRLEAPELIIINTGDQTSRIAFTSVDTEFATLLEIADLFLRSAFSVSQQYTTVSTEDFYSALTSKSIYLSYPTDYDAGLFSHLLGATRADFSGIFSQLKNIVISADGYIYIEDSASDIVYCCHPNVDTTGLNEIIDSQTETVDTDKPIINYAFDLGFDKAFATQKTVLSPMIPIYSSGFELETVSVSRPLSMLDGTFNETVVSGILPMFNMNPNSFRRYTEVDGTIVFVENNATLKISPDGCLEYTAKDNGMSLSNTTLPSSYDTVAAVADFVDTINYSAKSDSTMQLSSKLTSTELSESSFSITLDYLANGRRVVLNPGNIEPAVSATVTNNRLVHYKQHMRSFSTTVNFMSVDNYIYALDDTITKFQNQITDIEINELDIIYEDNFIDEILTPHWNVSVKEIVID